MKAFQVTIIGNDNLFWSNRVEAKTIEEAISTACEFVGKLSIEEFSEVSAKRLTN